MKINEDLKLIIEEMELNTYNFCDIFNYRKKLEDIQKDFGGKNIYEMDDEITFEILFLSYEIQEGNIIPLISNGDFSYPDYSLFNQECINYLEYRFKNTNNCLLKSLYSLILWEYYESENEKKIVYLQSFVDSSLNIISMVKSKESISSFDYLIMQRSLISAFNIGIPYNYRKSEIKNRIIDFIYDNSIENNFIKKDLIELMLDNKNIFKKIDFEGMDRYCWNLYLNDANIGYKVDFLKLIQRIDNKIESKNYNLDEEIAKSYEELMDENENFFAKYDFCVSAIQYYKKSGNKYKEFELLKELEYLKDNMELGIIEFPINNKPLEIYIDIDLSKRVLYSSFDMINYLIYSKNRLLISKFNENKDIYDSYLENSPLFALSSKKILDSNKNIRKEISSNNSEEEKINDINEREYIMSLEVINKTYLDRLFIFAYENKILSYEEIIKYLNYFFNFYIDDMSMLQFFDPLMKDYFSQLDFYLKNEKDIPIFIMFIDSICSKIEYLLKTICLNNDIIVRKVYSDGLTSMVSLKNIFDDEEFKNLINESDYYFLKYVLIEPGLNLRNKSAHGLDLSIYNFSNANLLLLCFLRIIKYL